MLTKRTFNTFEQQTLFTLMSHPDVLPFVRHKAYSMEQFEVVNKDTIEAEARGELISRVIMNEQLEPIGTINLFDIRETTGFLATWLGKPYQGKGYNQIAKMEFLTEVFTTTPITSVLMCIRHENIRSQKAAMKLPYVVQASAASWEIFKTVKENSEDFVLFEVPKALFLGGILPETTYQATPSRATVCSITG